MRVLFYDVADKLALGNARRCDTLDELLAEAETVSLHVDGRHSNAGLFGEAEFAKMRPRSLFLNLCRGIVVDHEALREHLRQRPHRRRGGGRLRRRAEDRGRSVRLEPARPAERDPDPAHRRLDRGGAGGHRPLRGRQAARLRRRAAPPPCRSTCRRCRPTSATGPASCTCTTTCPGCWPGQRRAGRRPGEHRGPGAVHPRRPGLRDHRRRRPLSRTCPTGSVSCPNGPAARHRLSSSAGLIV